MDAPVDYVGPLDQVPVDELPELGSDLDDLKPVPVPPPDPDATPAPRTARPPARSGPDDGDEPEPLVADRKVVPFGEKLKLWSRGNQVKAVQRALVHAGFGGKLKGATGIYGPFTRARVKAAQKHYGLPQTGVYGMQLHARLVRHFAPFEVFLYTGSNPNVSPEDRMRQRIVAAALAIYAANGQLRYTQTTLRMTIVRNRLRPPFGSVILFEDCSSSATGCYFIALAPDPNDRGYNGEGYTGTLWEHGRLVTLDQAKPGDLVFYKSPTWWRWPWAHVAVYIGGGKVWSFGSWPSRILPIDYRTGPYGRVGIRSYL